MNKECNESGQDMAIEPDGTESGSEQAIAREIRRCMENGFENFFLRYQPVFAPGTGKPIGVEALLRWKNKEFGEVTPGRFLADIEQDASFRALGYWILSSALTDGAIFLKSDPDFTVCVNVSPEQITDPDFSGYLAEIAEQAHFPLNRLQLEITRDCRLLPLDELCAFSEPLRVIGVKIGIDDFGSGNDWLGALRALQPDYVKFSAEFTQSIAMTEADREVVRHLSGLARAYEAEVFFKSVESEDTADMLSELTVQGAQGWFFSEVIYFDEVLGWISRK